MRNLGLAVLLGGSVMACTAGEHERKGEDVAAVRQAVLAGAASPAAEDFVVHLAMQIGLPTGQKVWAPRCSGTLVAPRLVLTAKKCIETAEVGVYLGVNARSVIESRPQPEPAVRVDHIVEDPTHDVAVLVLKAPITEKPTAAIRLDGPGVKGEKLAVVGYGDAAPPQPRSRKANVTVTRATKTGFDVTESACEDDQGGPALAIGDNGVVGVASLVAHCGEGGTAAFTTLSSARETIEAAFKEVGATPKKAAAPEGTQSADEGLGDDDDDGEETVQAGDDPEPDDLASAGCSIRGARARSSALPALLLVVAAVLARRARR